MVPPSPTVHEMNKYVDVPVNAYNGLPEISIPIYTVDVGQYSFPISLSYHASGLKVDEHASWVGAGWTLNATGQISRTMYGIADEYDGDQYYGYLSDHVSTLYDPNGDVDMDSVFSCHYLSKFILPGPQTNPLVRSDSIAQGKWDTMPDIFFYTLPNGSNGKFVFDRFSTYRDPVMLKPTTDQITEDPFGFTLPASPWNAADYSWKIKDDKGIIYTFSLAEVTDFETFNGQNATYDRHQSAWYLTRIDAHGEWIDFTYVNETITYDQTISESGSFLWNGPSQCDNCKDPVTYANSINQNTVYGKRLAEIETSRNERIVFNASTVERTDLAGSYPLTRIDIIKQGETIRMFDLGYDKTKNKLLLTSVQEEAFLASPLPPHTFTYYPGTIAAANTNGLDYWGFQNGKNNSSRIPAYRNGGVWVNHWTTVDREPNLYYSKAGTLQRWTYPTDGYTELEYELHDYYSTTTTLYDVYEAKAQGFQDLVNILPVIVTTDFSVGSTGAIAHIATQFQTDQAVFNNYAELRKWDGSSYVEYNPSAIGNSANNIYSLPAGDYRLYASNGLEGDVVTITAKVQEVTNTASSIDVGGLRVSKIRMHDPVTNQPTMSKVYRYVQKIAGTEYSSGKLFTPYVNVSESDYTPGTGDLGSCTSISSNKQTFQNITSTSILPAVTVSGSHVGYDRVEVISLDESGTGSNGKTVYTFVNDFPTVYIDPYVPGPDLDYKNGQMLTESVYRSEGTDYKLLTQTVNTYSDLVLTSGDAGAPAIDIPFFAIRNRSSNYCYTCSTSGRKNSYASTRVKRNVNWHPLATSTVTQYDDSQSEEFTSVTNYTYGNSGNYDHYYPTRISVDGRNNEDIHQVISRSTTHPGLVVQVDKYRGTVTTTNQVDGQKIAYKGVLPQTIYRWEYPMTTAGAGSYEESLAYSFNSGNRVTDVRRLAHENPGQPLVPTLIQGVLWSSNDSYLLASTQNASSTQVQYAGFEEEQWAPNWTYTTSGLYTTDAKTGEQSYDLSAGALTVSDVVSSGTYQISLWAKTGGLQIVTLAGGTNATVAALTEQYTDSRGWSLYYGTVTYSVSGTNSISITGNTLVDEIRLHPANAQMTTFSYDLSNNTVRSIMGPDHLVKHFLHDPFGRLIKVLDQDNNVIQQHEYVDVN
ncbi:MAG TPA: hypothetical protein DCE41_11370 [Cytophagales bacterium]|nr:hypothetical protein [Cytophagales bacterium]